MLTLPQSLGGIKTYATSGAVIMRSTNDMVEIFVNLQVDANTLIKGTTEIHDDTTIYGVLIVHASAAFDGNVTIGDKISFTASSGALELGSLKLNGDIDADNHQILGGQFLTTPGGAGGITMIGDTINFAGSGSLGTSGSRIQASVGMSILGNTQIGSGFGAADLTVYGGTRAEGGFGCNGAPAQGHYTIGGAATDLASVITLANNIRQALRNDGIAN